MDAPNIPKELQTKVSDALQELCMYLHDNVGSSTVLISLQHVSDAMLRQSSTSIAIMGGGIPIMRDTGASNAPKNKEEVDKVIAELMAKARAKQEPKPDAKAAEPKPEEPKPESKPEVKPDDKPQA